jgi:hypothetical protein
MAVWICPAWGTAAAAVLFRARPNLPQVTPRMADKAGELNGLAPLRTRTLITLFKLRRQAADARLDESVRGKPVLPGALPDAWARRRAPLRDADRVLTSPTHLWLRRIPHALHPKRLGRHYPRLANEIAAKWADYRAIDQLLASLTTDRRGHRRGFPPAIVRELRILQVVHQWRKYHRTPVPVQMIVQVCNNALRRPEPTDGEIR